MARFRDYSGRHDLPVARMPRPSNLAALRQEVLAAEQSRPPLGVSGVGSGWAFLRRPTTPVSELTPADWWVPRLAAGFVRQPMDGHKAYVAVAAGNRVRNLYLALFDDYTRSDYLARIARPPNDLVLPPAALTRGRACGAPDPWWRWSTDVGWGRVDWDARW